MNQQQQDQLQAEDDEISLIDLYLFLKASVRNIVKSTLFCTIAGGAYYSSVPKMYEASATIQMAKVAGDLVEAPSDLLEKMKLPLYFSPAIIQICGVDNGLSSHIKLVDKIKPSINKSTPMVSFVIQSPSTQEAKACLNAVIAEVSSKQAAIANPLLDQKKQKLNQLSEQLKIAEEDGKTLPAAKIYNDPTEKQLTASFMLITLRKTNVAEINDLRSQISNLEFELIEPKTRPTYLLHSVYSSGAYVNKRPLFTLGVCLALGVFLGLLVTGVMWFSPRILRQIREAEGTGSSAKNIEF